MNRVHSMSSTDTIHLALLVHCEGKNELAQSLYKTSFATIHFSLLMHAEQKVGRLLCKPMTLVRPHSLPFTSHYLSEQNGKSVGIHRMRWEGIGSADCDVGRTSTSRWHIHTSSPQWVTLFCCKGNSKSS